ncbi:MAG: TIGR03960 family B12-binding radical SAM protein, partial [Ruminococcaceae bacterium]|nr:TIGR03960 family B12-binding radical SAM protein [Oscillospiraceae bacterium]
ADFGVVFQLGEGEEMMMEVMDCYADWKKRGGTRQEFLLDVSKIDGIYVPSFYDIAYNDDGTVQSITPKNGAPERVKKRIIEDLDGVYYPDKMIVPFMEIVHDRVMLEVFRGCIRGCRFCQAGMIYRPVREKSPETLLRDAKNLLDFTGYEEISLASLSTSDYTKLPEFSDKLVDMTEKERVSLSLPSLRLDSFSMELMERVQKVRKSSLTFAPEAGTQRMRDVINKGITEQDLMTAARTAFEGGYTSVKLYFMIGLPTETLADVLGIGDLAKKVVEVYYATPKEGHRPPVKVTASVSSFVPKAFTPFQWEAQDTQESLREKQAALRAHIKDKKIKYNYHESGVSVLEGVFARGDRRLSKVLLRAHELGVRMDGWSEYFEPEKWAQAFDDCGIDPAFYTRARSFDEILPWDMVDVGVSKAFLIREAERAREGIVTPNCREKCAGCGAASWKGGVCVE